MTLYGKVVVIKRNGADGAKYPLLTDTCLFGRSNDCDIRIQLPNVAKEHCRLNISKTGEIFLTNLTTENPTILNNIVLSNEKPVKLRHKDIFTIIDRSFRLEFPDGSPQCEEATELIRTPPKLQDKPQTPKSVEKSPVKIATPKTKPPIITSKSAEIKKSPEAKSPPEAKRSPDTKRSPDQKKSPETKRSPETKLSNEPKRNAGRPPKTPETIKKVSSAVNGTVEQLNRTPKQLEKSLSKENWSDVRGKRKSFISSEDLAPNAKRKRVSFGPELSPERFDRRLPPLTPIKKGATPFRRLSTTVTTTPVTPLSNLRKARASLPAYAIIPEESPIKSASVRSPTPKKTPKTTKLSQKTMSAVSKHNTSLLSPKDSKVSKSATQKTLVSPITPKETSVSSKSNSPKGSGKKSLENKVLFDKKEVKTQIIEQKISPKQLNILKQKQNIESPAIKKTTPIKTSPKSQKSPKYTEKIPGLLIHTRTPRHSSGIVSAKTVITPKTLISTKVISSKASHATPRGRPPKSPPQVSPQNLKGSTPSTKSPTKVTPEKPISPPAATRKTPGHTQTPKPKISISPKTPMSSKRKSLEKSDSNDDSLASTKKSKFTPAGKVSLKTSPLQIPIKQTPVKSSGKRGRPSLKSQKETSPTLSPRNLGKSSPIQTSDFKVKNVSEQKSAMKPSHLSPKISPNKLPIKTPSKTPRGRPALKKSPIQQTSKEIISKIVTQNSPSPKTPGRKDSPKSANKNVKVNSPVVIKSTSPQSPKLSRGRPKTSIDNKSPTPNKVISSKILNSSPRGRVSKSGPQSSPQSINKISTTPGKSSPKKTPSPRQMGRSPKTSFNELESKSTEKQAVETMKSPRGRKSGIANSPIHSSGRGSAKLTASGRRHSLKGRLLKPKVRSPSDLNKRNAGRTPAGKLTPSLKSATSKIIQALVATPTAQLGSASRGRVSPMKSLNKNVPNKGKRKAVFQTPGIASKRPRLEEKNIEKILSPTSPDENKAAALMTIHGAKFRKERGKHFTASIRERLGKKTKGSVISSILAKAKKTAAAAAKGSKVTKRANKIIGRASLKHVTRKTRPVLVDRKNVAKKSEDIPELISSPIKAGRGRPTSTPKSASKNIKLTSSKRSMSKTPPSAKKGNTELPELVASTSIGKGRKSTVSPMIEALITHRQGRKSALYTPKSVGKGRKSSDSYIVNSSVTVQEMKKTTTRRSANLSESLTSLSYKTPEHLSSAMKRGHTPKSAGITASRNKSLEQSKLSETSKVHYTEIKTFDKKSKEKSNISYSGIKRLMKTPIKFPTSTHLRNVKKTPKVSPEINYSGIKELMKTPKSTGKKHLRKIETVGKTSKSPDYRGIRELLKTPKESPVINYVGVRELLKSPKGTPKIDFRGVKELLKTPKSSPQINYKGVRELLQTPKQMSSPNLSGLKELVKTPVSRTSEKTLTPSKKTPKSLKKTIASAKKSPVLGKKTRMSMNISANKTPISAKRTPSLEKKSPVAKYTPIVTKESIISKETRLSAKKSPVPAKKSPVSKKSPILVKTTPVTSKKTPPGSTKKSLILKTKVTPGLVKETRSAGTLVSPNKIPLSEKKSPVSGKKTPMAPTKKSPLTEKKTPVSEKKTRSGGTLVSPNKIPLSEKKTPVSVKKTPMAPTKKSPLTKKTPMSEKKTPVSAKKTLTSAKKTPASAKKISPVLVQKTPIFEKDTRRSFEKLVSAIKTSVSTKKTPVMPAEKTPETAKKIIGSTNNTPVSSKKSPIYAKNSPVTTKKYPVSAKKSTESAKKTPIPVKETRLSRRGMPILMKKSPLLAIKTPSPITKTPVSTKKTPNLSQNTPSSLLKTPLGKTTLEAIKSPKSPTLDKKVALPKKQASKKIKRSVKQNNIVENKSIPVTKLEQKSPVPVKNTARSKTKTAGKRKPLAQQSLAKKVKISAVSDKIESPSSPAKVSRKRSNMDIEHKETNKKRKIDTVLAKEKTKSDIGNTPANRTRGTINKTENKTSTTKKGKTKKDKTVASKTSKKNISTAKASLQPSLSPIIEKETPVSVAKSKRGTIGTAKSARGSRKIIAKSPVISPAFENPVRPQASKKVAKTGVKSKTKKTVQIAEPEIQTPVKTKSSVSVLKTKGKAQLSKFIETPPTKRGRKSVAPVTKNVSPALEAPKKGRKSTTAVKSPQFEAPKRGRPSVAPAKTSPLKTHKRGRTSVVTAKTPPLEVPKTARKSISTAKTSASLKKMEKVVASKQKAETLKKVKTLTSRSKKGQTTTKSPKKAGPKVSKTRTKATKTPKKKNAKATAKKKTRT